MWLNPPALDKTQLQCAFSADFGVPQLHSYPPPNSVLVGCRCFSGLVDDCSDQNNSVWNVLAECIKCTAVKFLSTEIGLPDRAPRSRLWRGIPVFAPPLLRPLRPVRGARGRPPCLFILLDPLIRQGKERYKDSVWQRLSRRRSSTSGLRKPSALTGGFPIGQKFAAEISKLQ